MSLGKFQLDDIPPMPRGQPQIEVSFDLDANCILNVSAVEKSTGKSNKITITNDKGRLSKEDIDRMVEEAERYKEEDLKVQEKIEAKNSLDNSVFRAREHAKSAENKAELEAVIQSAESVLEDSGATKEEFDSKRMEVDALLAKTAVPGGSPFPFPSGPPADGPQIDEVD
jgi:L1 cell adhesion molecule like protein